MYVHCAPLYQPCCLTFLRHALLFPTFLPVRRPSLYRPLLIAWIKLHHVCSSFTSILKFLVVSPRNGTLWYSIKQKPLHNLPRSHVTNAMFDVRSQASNLIVSLADGIHYNH